MDMEKRKEEILQKLLEENRQDGASVHDAEWAGQAQDDMRDWIEQQGIYIRQ